MSDVAALFTWVNMRFLLQGLGLTLFISALAIACSVAVSYTHLREARWTPRRKRGC